MQFHKSSSSESLLKRGPRVVAMMVASEFSRAHEGADFKEDVVRCYLRARELMGVLEVADLPESVGSYLQPFYKECSSKSMFNEERLLPSAIQAFSKRLGEAFDHAAQELAHA